MINRIQIFVGLLLVLTCCTSPSRSGYIERELCNIICTLIDKELIVADTIHNRVLIKYPIRYLDGSKSIDAPEEIILNPDFSTCDCQEFILLDKGEDIFTGKYNRVYTTSIFKYPNRNDHNIGITGFLNLNSHDFVADHDTRQYLSYTIKVKKGKWVFSDENTIKYESPWKWE